MNYGCTCRWKVKGVKRKTYQSRHWIQAICCFLLLPSCYLRRKSWIRWSHQRMNRLQKIRLLPRNETCWIVWLKVVDCDSCKRLVLCRNCAWLGRRRLLVFVLLALLAWVVLVGARSAPPTLAPPIGLTLFTSDFNRFVRGIFNLALNHHFLQSFIILAIFDWLHQKP